MGQVGGMGRHRGLAPAAVREINAQTACGKDKENQSCQHAFNRWIEWLRGVWPPPVNSTAIIFVPRAYEQCRLVKRTEFIRCRRELARNTRLLDL